MAEGRVLHLSSGNFMVLSLMRRDWVEHALSLKNWTFGCPAGPFWRAVGEARADAAAATRTKMEAIIMNFGGLMIVEKGLSLWICVAG